MKYCIIIENTYGMCGKFQENRLGRIKPKFRLQNSTKKNKQINKRRIQVK